jgi:hypothetical protein
MNFRGPQVHGHSVVAPAPRAAILKKRTLTHLYNERPIWLRNAHARLDTAVAAAYGFPTEISGDDALAHLLPLNHTQAK